MKRWATIVAIVLLFPFVAKAGKVRAYVSASKIGIEDTLTFTIEGENLDGDLTIASPLKFPDFTVVSGPNRGTSLSIINSSITKKETLSFVLAPLKEGKLTIPSFTVKAGNKEYKTDPITVEVVSGSILPKRRNSFRDPFEDFFNDDFFRPPPTRQVRAEDIFIRTETDKKEVYVGEPVIVKYRLFTTVPVTQLALEKVPSFQGFLAYDKDSGKKIRFEAAIVGGKRYSSAVILTKVLYPTMSGELKIPPVSFILTVQADFFFGKRIRRLSEPLRIKVKPLPQPPSDFSGLVGQFDISAQIDKNKAKVGESLTLKVKVFGKGDLKVLENIVPDAMEGFKVFKPSSPSVKARDPVNQQKEWDIVLVPEKEGELTVPPLSLTYFDPETEQYRTETTPPIKVEVKGILKDAVETEQTGANNAKGGIKTLNRDIEFIKTGKLDTVRYIAENGVFKTFVVVLPILSLILGLFVRITDEKRKNDVEYRKNNAYSFFKKKLKKAKKHGKKGNSKEFYQTLSKAVVGYFADKFSKPSIELQMDEVAHILKEKGIEQNLVKQLVDFVEYCDFESYTPHSSGVKLELIDEANQLIQKVEKEL